MTVTLRPWRDEDAQALQDLCSHADRRYLSGRMPFPYTLSDARWWLDKVQADEQKEKGIFRAILFEGKIVGNITIERHEDIRFLDGELGYLLDHAYWSKGIMSQATAQIVQEAFEQLPIIRISASTCAPNLASRRVLEKNGFKLEGILHSAYVKEDTIYDACLYAKYKDPLE